MLWAAVLACGMALSIGALFALHDYATPRFVNGGDMARRIDAEMGDVIVARFARVAVGAAQCAPVIDVTANRKGRCVLPVAGSELRVDIEQYGPNSPPVLTNADALFVTPDAETALRAQLLERYGEPFDVHCPGPDVRLIAEEEPTVTCSVEAPDVLRRGISVTVIGIQGDLHAEEIPSVPKRAERTFGTAVASRKDGSVSVGGPAMERYIRDSAAADARGEVAGLGLLGAVHCPGRIVLHEGDRTTCTLWAGGLPLRYDVRFEKGLGLYVETDQGIEPVAQIREYAARYFERPQYTGGKPLAVRVDCGAQKVAFVEPGTSVSCTATVGQDERSFTFHYNDRNGDFAVSED